MGRTANKEIADELDVAKSSVSVWVRDVEFEAKPRKRVAQQKGFVHPLRKKKLAEIERLNREGRDRIGRLSEREFLIAGAALYACEGSKRGAEVRFANSDARLLWFFVTWLRHFFVIDEGRLRLRLYLHEGLDLAVATSYWSDLTGIPISQFIKPYRAEADRSIRTSKHRYGCPAVYYCSTELHRTIMGLARAFVHPGALGAFADDGGAPIDELLQDETARAW